VLVFVGVFIVFVAGAFLIRWLVNRKNSPERQKSWELKRKNKNDKERAMESRSRPDMASGVVNKFKADKNIKK
jgi:hypothetical protein